MFIDKSTGFQLLSRPGMTRSRVNALIFLLILSFVSLFGQSNRSVEDRIRQSLIRSGFENVAVLQDSSGVVIKYENRIYRFEVRALFEALNCAAGQLKAPMDCILIPLNRGVPLMAVIVDLKACRVSGSEGSRLAFPPSAIRTALDIEPYWSKIKDLPGKNPPFMKLDVFVHPQVKAQFGNINDAVESQINLAPAASILLWKGMSVSAQWIFPVQNEMGYEGDFGRPGLVTMNQTIRLPYGAFLSGTAGYFTEHRYGGDLEVKTYWKNGRWAAAVNAGYTGFAACLNRVWYHSDLTNWTYWFSGEYRFPELDFTVKTGYGKFLYQDDGWRFDIHRQFGEVSVGFFAMRTEGGRNGGFAFSIPVFPAKRMAPNRFRISPALSFPWSYRYRGMPVYGIQYDTQNRLDGFMESLNPDFVMNQLSRMSGGRP
jgi:hypothetical protein